ncbi:MAG: ABC transporter ATP-binding protein [Acidovorax sp.]|jgi:peptide/nickel transport system ATP-binding protein|nr:ABC transporter ATP-binding protein [Acidovorax sp.]
MALLEVENLSITLRTHRAEVAAVRGVSFTLERGGTLGLIGESGSGKSLTALALMGLLPDNALATGSLRLQGQELLGQSEAQWCQLRGNRLAMVFQEPMTALNPVHPIGRQVAEPLRRHLRLDAASAQRQALALLERVGIPRAAERLGDYPHQFSGGQRQRIMIAMALACQPDVLIADEPTTALDVTVQQQILDLMADLVAERGMGLVLISHDLGVVSQNVDQMMVMYGGSVVERGPTEALFAHMAHPYTRGLLAARPQLHTGRLPDGSMPPLPTISGTVPDLANLPAGCAFSNRCSYAQAACHSQVPAPVAQDTGGLHWARCLHPSATGALQ